MVPFVFQYRPDCNFAKFTNFALGTVKSERIKRHSEVDDLTFI